MARRQATIVTNTRVLSIGILKTNLCGNVNEIHIFFIKEKTPLKMSSAKWRPCFSASMCQPGSTVQCARTEPESVRRWEHLAGPRLIPVLEGHTGKHLCKHIFYTHSSQTSHISLLRARHGMYAVKNIHRTITAMNNTCIWVRSRNCGCLVTWFLLSIDSKTR